MGRNRRKRKRRPAADDQAVATTMSRRQRRAGNRTAIFFVAVLALVLCGIIWHLVDEVSVDLVVYLPESDSAAGNRWVSDLREEGFHVHVFRDADPKDRRRDLHVPDQFSAEASAVTVNPDRYVISGFVPPAAIRRALQEQRPFYGLAIADSPSAGGGPPAPGSSEVWGFWRDGRRELYVLGPPLSVR